ncbi:GNAT family N-acetyltransferase (plasmid) [Alteromonas macleodii]|uniref:GNAT family N-acetyltransferase n=1 Tax=Alteromonas macleodii TaxID=28108 RepID=UPI0030CCD1E3
MASSLIPKDGGVNPINGLPIRRHVCVVYDNATLEILAIADTHNKADEIATDRFHRGIDAISSEIRYHNDDISPAMLVGMKMNDFQCFVDNNNHPLNPSTKKVDALTFVTDLDSVQLAYIESDIQKLTDMAVMERGNVLDIAVMKDDQLIGAFAFDTDNYMTQADMATEERNCGTVLDIAILKDGEFAGGFAFELDNNDDHTELELTYVYVKAELRGKGLASRMSCAACDAITETLCNEPEHIKAFAHIESDGGWAVCDKVTQQLSERYPNATVSLHDENTMNIAP